MAFLGACFVRRFSLNAFSVPPLGQVQALCGWGVSLLVALGTLLGVLGTSWGACGRSWVFFWALLERSWSLLGSLGLQVVDFWVIFR